MVKGGRFMKKLLCALILLCSTSSFSETTFNWNEKLLLEYKDYTGAVLGAMANYHIRCGGISAQGGKFIEEAVEIHSFDVENTQTNEFYERGFDQADSMTCQKLRRGFTMLNIVHLLAEGEHYDD
jgi:hypothetical protein